VIRFVIIKNVLTLCQYFSIFPRPFPVRNIIINMGPILNCYGNMGILNVTCSSRRGHVDRQVNVHVAPQLSVSAVRRVVASINCEHVIYIFQ